MSNRPIFVATHPRACSTAFERVFMTRRNSLHCIHEPFGDAFYFGPERLSERYEDDEQARIESGFSESTFKSILDRIDSDSANAKGKRLFIKDITHYLVPPKGQSASIAPSLVSYRRGVGTSEPSSPIDGTSSDAVSVRSQGSESSQSTAPFPYSTEAEPGNPTVIPEEFLRRFHFTFLIRHPKFSVPSYYRCTIPPLDKVTGFYSFMPSEAGYDELRRVFDYLCEIGHVGPRVHGKDEASNGMNDAAKDIGDVEICVIDADDLLDNPSGIIQAYCKSVGIEYTPDMLNWDDDKEHYIAKEAFEKWKGFHEDAINSSALKPRTHRKKVKNDEQIYSEWAEKYGEEGARIIEETVEANVADYEYLKQFAIKA